MKQACRDRAMPSDPPALILASGSSVRTRLLTAAGVEHTVHPADVDEAAVRDGMTAENASHGDIAEALAELKAQTVAQTHPGKLVLGADQILSCDGRVFEKPRGLPGVRAHLNALMGKEHSLFNAACIVRDGEVVWHHLGQPVLHMRRLSEGFVEGYIAAVGEDVCQSVGAYQLEGRGVQLFSRIDGDFFDILGLPMLPLLEYLRKQQVIEG